MTHLLLIMGLILLLPRIFTHLHDGVCSYKDADGVGAPQERAAVVEHNGWREPFKIEGVCHENGVGDEPCLQAVDEVRVPDTRRCYGSELHTADVTGNDVLEEIRQVEEHNL